MEALAWCRAAMPDAVLLDWNMPAMNGIEFLRRLRAEPEGYQSGGDLLHRGKRPRLHINEALEAGADEYIVAKPFDGDIISLKFAEAGL